MKLKNLKSALTYVKDFQDPKIDLEQYITPAELAANLAYTAHFQYNDIEDKCIVDLCAGTGMLSVACSFFSPKSIVSIDCDEDALAICKENMEYFEIENNNIVNQRIEDVDTKCDTVIMNPPFGTRNSGADIMAVEKAMQIGNVVYSLHKTSTRKYILSKFTNAVVLAELKYDLHRTQKFHKKEKKEIYVDLIRFVK